MTTGKALDGKPYAGNPHVRFDEGEVASAATPSRGSLLYKQNTKRMMMMAAISMSVFGWCTALADTWTDDYGRVWTYTVKDGAATVGGNSYISPAVNRSTVGDIVIPDTLGGCPVTTIAGSAFQECANIRSIVIPDSVTSIKRSAFAYCTSLRLLKFGNGISSINYGTSSQSQYVGGDNGGIKRIVTYDNPFKGCSALAGIEFGTNTMSYLKMSNFSDSKRLSYIYFSGQFPTTVNGTMPGIESRGIYVTHDAYPNGLPQTMLAGVPLKFLEGELPSEGKSWDLIFVSLTANGVLQRPSFFLSAETNSTTSCVRFFEGDPIYCWYSCMDFWGVADIANSFTNVLHLSGTDEVAYSVNDNESTNGSAHYYYWDSQLFGNLQNLPLGEYKATLVLNETRAIQETSYANNTNTITFSVVPSTTITFVSEGNAVDERRYETGAAYGSFPANPIRQGFRFVGWFTEEERGDVVTASSIVPDTPATLYAHWEVAIQQTLAVGGTLASGETKWLCGNLYKVTSDLVVPLGATLTIEPGVIVKFAAGKSLTVNSGGVLNAQGTRALPIVFTSIKDDANGGDTNGDGISTFAQGGDWYGIWIYGRADFAHSKMMYAGPSNERGIVQTSDSGVLTMDSCTVAHARYDGIWNWGGTVSVKNSIILDTGWASAPYRGSKNEYVNCVFYQNNVGLCYWGHWSGKPIYKNCIFAECLNGWCETASGKYGDPPAAATIGNCLFFNSPEGGMQSCGRIGKNGNIWANPLFVNPDNGDFRIAANSPCVDAGDGTVAPEKDYYGLERRDVGKVTDSGVPSANGNCPDIGIHEVLWDEDESPYDIAPIAVSVDKTKAKVGDNVKVSWTIQNLGTEDVVGGWHDAVSLISTSGQSVELGEVLTTYTFKRKMSMNVNGTFTIPALPEGTWYARVNTNNRRSDVPEGLNTTNNVLTSAHGIAIAVTATPYANGTSGTLSVGNSTVVKFTFPAGTTGQIARVSVPAGLSVSYGLDFMPQGAYASGTMTATEKGEAMFHVPAGTTEVYLVMDAAQSEGQNYSVAFEDGDLAITSVSPNTVPSSGSVSLTIKGAGFSNDLAVSLVNGAQTLSGIDVLGVSPENIEAQIDCASLQPGATYDLLVSEGDVQVLVTAAITTLSESGSWNIEYEMETPDSVREQRVFSGWIVFENSGNIDAPLPIFILSSDDNNTRFMTSSRSAVWRTKLSLLGVSYAGQSSVKPGEKCRIPFYAKVTSARAGSISIATLDETRTVDYNDVCAVMNFDAFDPVLMQKIRGLYGLNWSDFADSIRQFVIKYPDMVKLDYDINALVNKYLTECEGKRVYGRLTTTTVVPDGIKMILYNVSEECETPTVTAVSYCDAEGVFCFQNITNGYYCIRAESVNTEPCLVEMSDSGEDVSVVLNQQPFGMINIALPLGTETYSTNLVLAFENRLTHEQVEHKVPYRANSITVDNLYSGEYSVTLFNDGQLLSAVDSVGVSDAEISLDIAPVDFLTLSGTVLSSEGESIDAVINVGNKRYRTDSLTGCFSFNTISNDYILLCCSAEGYESHVEMIEKFSESITVRLVKSVKVSGRVLLDGEPVSAGSIIEFKKDDRSQFCIVLDDGRYSIELEAGNWVASYANMEGYIQSVSVTVEISTMEFDIAFESGIVKKAKLLKSSDGIIDTAELIGREAYAFGIASLFDSFYGVGMGYYEPAKLLWCYLDIPGYNFGRRIAPVYFGIDSAISRRAKSENDGFDCPYLTVFATVKSHIIEKIEKKCLNGCDRLYKPRDIKSYMDFNGKKTSPLFATFGGTKSVAYEYGAKKIDEDDEYITYHVDVVTTATDVYEFDDHTDPISTTMIILEKAGWATRFDVRMDIKDEFICKIPKDKDPDPEKEKKRRRLTVPQSCDPNEIVGPEGVGEARYVQPGEWMNYTIYFENKTNATAAAQEVYVTNPLSEWLDWSTFEMGEVSFNNQIDIGLSGLCGGMSEVQMSGTNFAVRTVLGGGNDGEGVIATSGVAHWYMRIVDNSDETTWPADPYAGFLPPNDDTHCGEGHISYRIKVRDDAPRNVIITNSATIVFDYNAPIETDPAWWNTVGTLHDVELEVDGVMTNLTLIAGEPFGELPTPKTARTGYTFDGWYTGENGTGPKATPDALVPTGDFMLYANWIANNYVIAYKANGGEGEMPLQTNTYDSVVCLVSNAFTRTSHRFFGWAVNETGEVVYEDGAVVSNLTAVAGGIADLYAVWELITMEVSFDLNYADAVEPAPQSIVVTNGMEYGTLPEADRTGYAFDGWANSHSARYARVAAETVVTNETDHTLYAQWLPNAYSVRFNACGGTGVMPDQSLAYDHASRLAQNAFSYPRHAFCGWATNEAGEVVYENEAEVLNLTTEPNAVVDLYAVWAEGVIFAEFIRSEVVQEEGGLISVRVSGGNDNRASFVDVYLTYNTAVAADVDVAKGAVEGVTPKGGLKFPLTLTWEKGEIGEKVITIPVKTDKAVEGDEFFTLQLANAHGVQLGETTVCTVTIKDKNTNLTLQEGMLSPTVTATTKGDGSWFVASGSPLDEAGLPPLYHVESPTLAQGRSSTLALSAVKGMGVLYFSIRFSGDPEEETPSRLDVYEGKRIIGSFSHAEVTNDWKSYKITINSMSGSHAYSFVFTQGSDPDAHAEVSDVTWDSFGNITLTSFYRVYAASNDPAGGIVSGSGWYSYGQAFKLVARPFPGWKFDGWYEIYEDEDSGAEEFFLWSTSATVSYKIDRNAKVIAFFSKIPYVCGLANPADGGKVSGNGYCDKGKKVTLKATTNKNFTFVGWTTNAARSVIAPYQDGDFVAKTPSLVIDRSAKPAANSKTSTTITEIDGDVTYYAVFKSDPEIFVTVDATDGTGAELTGKGAGKYVAGTITGMGKYAPGKTKIALKAAANKGYVFAGWFDADSGLLTKNATYTVASMGESDVEYTAKFVMAEEDKDSIALGVNGAALSSAADVSPTSTNIWCGVYLEWPVAASALSEAKVKVAGLPSGLKFTDKPVTSKIGSGKTAITVTNVPANTIYGAPTAASKTTTDRKTGEVTVKPSAVKITVTTAGKSSQTYQIDTVVDALPAWAVGTFSGGWETEDAVASGGQVSLTVDAKGKMSGKALGDGLTYTLAAPYYSGFALDKNQSSNFLADVTATWSYKEGTKTVKTNDVVQLIVQDNGIGGYALAEDWFEAYTVNWKVEPWKTLVKSFDKKTMTYAIREDGEFIDDDDAETVALGEKVVARVTLKFAASGAVTIAGEFVTGYDAKKGKYTTVKATGSATLVPVDEEHFSVFIYLAPKGLLPHVRCIDVPWPEE